MYSIFPNEETKVEAVSGNLLSFKDCPHGCRDGYYIDPYRTKNKRVLCPYCAEKRKMLAKQSIELKGDTSNLVSALNLPETYTGMGEFSFDTVLPEFTRPYIKPESLSAAEQKITSLVEELSAGVLPEYSILINLGDKAYVSNLLYALVIRTYLSGCTVAPLLSSYDICMARVDDYKGESGKPKYAELLKYDLCVVFLDAGSGYNDIGAVKGLMQNRALKDKVTIIVTHFWGSSVYTLIGDESFPSKSLATLISVEYIERKSGGKTDKPAVAVAKPSMDKGNLTSDQFKQLMSSGNNL